jgi:type IV secretory pathway TrbL component
MPTLVRFLVVLIVLAAIGIAGMFYLANFVEPHTREMIVKVPADRLQPRDAAAPAAAGVPPAAAAAPAGATPAALAPAVAPATADGQPAKPPKPLND